MLWQTEGKKIQYLWALPATNKPIQMLNKAHMKKLDRQSSTRLGVYIAKAISVLVTQESTRTRSQN